MRGRSLNSNTSDQNIDHPRKKILKNEGEKQEEENHVISSKARNDRFSVENVAKSSFIPSSTYHLTNIIFLRLLGLLFFTAFNVALFQNVALLGSKGLVPACKAAGFSDVIKFTWTEQARASFISRPSLFWFIGCNDEVLTFTALVGVVASLVPLVFGACNVFILAILWQAL